MDEYYNEFHRHKEFAQEDPLFRVSQIGNAHAITSNNAIEKIKADIWRGAGNIELSANGFGKSTGQGITGVTFEGIDPTQRRAIRELSKINDVNITTHSSFQVGNLSGLDPQNGFSEQRRRMNMDEVKKAIEFSAEAANGGSVVVHTGEFPRALDVSKDLGGFGEGEFQFQMHEKEREEAVYSLVDKKTGQIQNFRGNTTVFRPKYEYEKNGEYKYLTDHNGKPLIDDVLKKDLEIKHQGKYNSFDEMPEELQKDAYIKLYKTDHDGNLQVEDITLNKFIQQEREKGKTDTGQILKDFFKEQAYGQIDSALGQARYYEGSYTGGLESLERTKEQLVQFEQLRKEFGENSAQWKSISDDYKQKMGGANVDGDVIELLNEKLANDQRQILHGREAGIGGRKQAFQLLEAINNTTTMEDYALKKSDETLIELGNYAISEYEKARRMRPNDKIKPIQLTLENIYPENGYGSHPDELIDVVQRGRDKLAEDLQKNNRYGKSEAKELAKQTIGVTLDTGHLNMWRKYFKPKDGEKKEETDTRFKKWYVKQVEKLAKKGVIGNMHIADNMGWDDSHLAAGQGNAPVREVMEILHKYGYDDVVTSEGGYGYTEHPDGELGLHETWKMAGAGIFSDYHGRPTGTDAWTSPGSRMYNVQNSYLGAGNKPNFIFKGYSPEGEDWGPWSGSGME